jgi:hypothetical protein
MLANSGFAGETLIAVREMQLPKALLLMEVTLSGMVTEVRAGQ